MDISNLIEFIKSRNDSQIKFKLHSVDRLFQRGLNNETLKHYIQNEEIVGVHKQNNNVFKLWYTYTTSEDLSIVISINKEQINIITTFLETNKRRLKNNGK